MRLRDARRIEDEGYSGAHRLVAHRGYDDSAPAYLRYLGATQLFEVEAFLRQPEPVERVT